MVTHLFCPFYLSFPVHCVLERRITLCSVLPLNATMSRKCTLAWYLIPVSVLLLSTHHASATPFSQPTLHLDIVGQLGLAGDFAGLSPYVDTQQFNYNGAVSSLVLSNNNTFLNLATANGPILATCHLSTQDAWDIYVGGNFTLLNNTAMSYIARWNTQTQTLSALDQGLDGPVQTLYCDEQTKTVYVGGDFIAPAHTTTASDYGGGVALWTGVWAPLPWKGFNGPVYTITQNPNTNTLLLGGRFDATGDGKYFNANSSQSVSLGASTTLNAGNGAFSHLGNPGNVVCTNTTLPSSESPWLLQTGVPGYWEAVFAYALQPSMFRLSNTHYQDKGTNVFNIIALGSNEILQLSYIDPETQQMTVCSEECHLSNDPNILSQDFTVLSPIYTTGIRININSWYGSGGGLEGVEIFQSDIALHAHLDTSNGACGGVSSSSTTATGTWVEKYVYGTYQNFLTSTFPASSLPNNNASITYTPYIPAQGQYTVYANTPGCVGSSTCNQRTQVQFTINTAINNSTRVIVDQAVTQDTRTAIYSGFLSATSSAFQPTIVLDVPTDATAPISGTVSLVAASLEFIINSTGITLSSILEYSPQNYSTNITPAWRPLNQQLMYGSTVRAIDASQENQLYIAGQFVSLNDTYRNIVGYNYQSGGGQLVPLSGSGLNNNVSSLLMVGSNLYVGGSFNSTISGNEPLNRVASYDTVKNQWSGLSMGLDGSVDTIIASGNTLTFSGNLARTSTPNSTLTRATITIGNNVLWDTTTHQWVETSPLVVGSIRSIVPLGASQQLWAGSIRGAQKYSAKGLLSIDGQNQWTPYLLDMDTEAVINTGLFWKNTSHPGEDQTVIIVGGRFTISDSIMNLAMYQNGVWRGIGQLQGQVLTLALVENKLLVGGEFSGTFLHSQSKSFAIYDLVQQTSLDVNGVNDVNGHPGRVNAIQVQDNSPIIYVAGNFTFAGSLDCASVCSLNTNTLQWDRVARGLNGEVYGLTVSNGDLVAVGALHINHQPVYIAQLHGQDSEWTSPTLPVDDLGTSTAVLSMPNQLLIAGSNAASGHLGTWDGHQYTSLVSNLGPSTDIRQLLYVPILDSPKSDRFPANSEDMLMAVGNIEIEVYGNVSAALYDGSSWYPYVLTTKNDGTPGKIRQLLHASPCCTVSNITRHLPVPAVILISIAISLGIIFLLVLAGLFFVFIRRHHAAKDDPEPMPPWASGRRASKLISMLDTAQLSALGGMAAYEGEAAATHEKSYQDNKAMLGVPPKIYTSHATDRTDPTTGLAATAAASFGAMVSAAIANRESRGADAPVSEECPQLVYAKYPFEAKEYGELSFGADEAIIVTDMNDSVWWMGYKDDGYGKPTSGLFPSNYVSSTRT
ncbi:cortical protein marker for cell polarity-domain-containing protein [Spinellus fusiger]|nr:cortical protein marker for cell polarity-domain-containing protein [Spinellus fusiger]